MSTSPVTEKLSQRTEQQFRQFVELRRNHRDDPDALEQAAALAAAMGLKPALIDLIDEAIAALIQPGSDASLAGQTIPYVLDPSLPPPFVPHGQQYWHEQLERAQRDLERAVNPSPDSAAAAEAHERYLAAEQNRQQAQGTSGYAAAHAASIAAWNAWQNLARPGRDRTLEADAQRRLELARRMLQQAELNR